MQIYTEPLQEDIFQRREGEIRYDEFLKARHDICPKFYTARFSG